jgi:transcriptional regulator with XRE-family HTH domain
MSTFSERLREAVEASKKSKRAIEKETPMGKGYLSHLLKEGGTRGTNPSDDMVKKLAKVLGVRPEWLSEGVPPMRGGVEDEDPLPERASAVAFAHAAGYPEPVIAKAYDRARMGPRLTHDQWLDRLRGWKAAYEAGDLEERGEPATEKDFPKPRYRRDR